MTTRSFTTSRPSRPGPTFDVDGETFACRDRVPGGLVVDLLADRVSRDQLYAFFEAAMEPGEYARFHAFIHDPGRVVEFDLLGDIVAWLVSEYSGGRPTPPSSPSSLGHDGNGASSTGDSSSPASTPTAALPIGS